MNRQQQFNIWYWIGAFLLLLLFQGWWQGASVTERIPYSRFLELLQQDRIAEVQVRPDSIFGRYREPIEGRTHFLTTIVPEDLTRRLEAGFEHRQVALGDQLDVGGGHHHGRTGDRARRLGDGLAAVEGGIKGAAHQEGGGKGGQHRAGQPAHRHAAAVRQAHRHRGALPLPG